MSFRRLLVVPALCAAVATSAHAQSPAANLAAFDQFVAKAARDWNVPGLAVAIVKNDSLVFAKGYGVLEIGKPAPATEHSRFAIGSTTKAMTSASLAMLVDEGKVHFDDHVTDYIPELKLADPYATRELTIRDLLTHRTGLPGTDQLWTRWQYSMPEMIRRMRYVKASESFRSTWQYNNIMYAITGTIVERVSGMPWDAFIRTRIFAPLGMNESIPARGRSLPWTAQYRRCHTAVWAIRRESFRWPTRTTSLPLAPSGRACPTCRSGCASFSTADAWERSG